MINIIIYADTRQKAGKHDKKHNQILQLGHQIVHKALKCGDYMPECSTQITIDTKQDLQELAGNLGNDRTRFYKEVRYAFNNGIKLIVLIEQGNYHNVADVANWTSKYGRLDGRALMKKMYSCHIAYGTEFLFCDKRVTGKKIIELFSN